MLPFTSNFSISDGIVLDSNGAIDLYASSGDITIGAGNGNVEIAASDVVNSNGAVTVTPPASPISIEIEDGMSISNIEDTLSDTSSNDSEDEE